MKGVDVTPNRGRSRRIRYAILGLEGKRVFSPNIIVVGPTFNLAKHRVRVLHLVRQKFLDGRVTSGLYVDVRAIRVRQRGLLHGLKMRGSLRTVHLKRRSKLLD